jgi:hypothetical protein
MSFAKKILSPLRNAFSYAAHLESAADHDRKPESVERLFALSPVPEDADDGYALRLRKVLMKTRTKHLETLAREGVGAACCVTYTDWKAAAHFEPGAMQKNPALRQPLKKRAAAPRP